MSKYLLYMPNKNCAEIPYGYHNIAVSLGGYFFGAPFIMNLMMMISALPGGRSITRRQLPAGFRGEMSESGFPLPSLMAFGHS